MCSLYSYRWAEEVYEEWYSRYPRATETVSKILGISRLQAVYWIAENDKFWQAFKQCRKLWGRLTASEKDGSSKSVNYTYVEYSVRELWAQSLKRITIDIDGMKK